jgi:hypothetical protein
VTVPWLGDARAGWLDEVRAWLGATLGAELTPGELECVRERPWSIVLRVPRHGRVYFKATAPGSRHEPALLVELSRRFADLVPAPLAIDASRGWSVLPDHGRTLRDALAGADGFDAFLRVLPRYAELQLASSRDPGQWLALGVPDRRLERLPALLEALLADDEALSMGHEGGLQEAQRSALRAHLPELKTACNDLAALTAHRGDRARRPPRGERRRRERRGTPHRLG